jgi:hypothetical protein
MTAEDVGQVCRALPSAKVLAIHLEAVNHCTLTRAGLTEYLLAEGLSDRVTVPADGSCLHLYSTSQGAHLDRSAK